jgi:hypothetical protein
MLFATLYSLHDAGELKHVEQAGLKQFDYQRFHDPG